MKNTLQNFQSSLNILIILCLFLVSLFCFNVYRKNTLLESRLNTTSQKIQMLNLKYKVDSSYIIKQQFKEDYYITQLDREMNIIVVAMSIFFVLFGLISYLNVEARLRDAIGNQAIKLTEQELKYKSLEHSISIDFGAVSTRLAYLFSQLAKDAYHREDYGNFFAQLLFSLRSKLDFYLTIKQDKRLADETCKSVKTDLDNLIITIKLKGAKTDLSAEMIINILMELTNFDDPEIKLSIANILGLLKLKVQENKMQ